MAVLIGGWLNAHDRGWWMVAGDWLYAPFPATNHQSPFTNERNERHEFEA
jgi:hypothetical protein